jgi:Putative auto-transporter adhesin, head GIN domain
MEQKRSLFGPLLLIAAGVIWLLVKSGDLPASNLWALTHIWPYLLIAAGLGLILRQYWRYTSILLDVLIIGGAVLAIVYAPTLGWDNPSMTGFINIGDNDFNVGPGERGSGNVITQTREVSDFTSIEMDYPAQVFITQGESVSVKVEAEDNLLPGLQTRVSNGTLEIFYKVDDGKRVNPTKAIKVTIVAKDLKEVDFNSAGELTIDGLETDELDISVSGAGNLKLNDITAKDLSVDLSGAGNTTASGVADNLNVIISGFGSFNGKDLHNKSADVNLSGAGSATVWVDDQLDATISGAGSVNYYGSPNVTKQISGIGDVSKSGDK